MTKIQIIDETVEYYRTHPRGMDSKQKNCVYLSAEGNKCAVGRCMTEEALGMYGDYVGNVEGVAGFTDIHRELSDIFQPEYRGHTLGFWSRLQYLHDNHRMWKTLDNGFNELTEKGLSRVEELKEIYAEPELVSA